MYDRLLLYVAEDSADDMQKIKKHLNDPDTFEFKYVCDEILGDG